MALGYKKKDKDDQYSPENYTPSTAVEDALAAYNAHVKDAPDFNAQLENILAEIKARPAFQYNMNADALYQMYKNQYQNNAQLAMRDAMGQAAALTGGYGNSYAQTVGQQAYNQQMSQLDNILPSLYQLALDQYNQEGTALQNQYALVKDQQSDWEAERDRLLALYQNERNFDYGQHMDAVQYGNTSDLYAGLYGNNTTDVNTQYADVIADLEKYDDNGKIAYLMELLNTGKLQLNDVISIINSLGLTGAEGGN